MLLTFFFFLAPRTGDGFQQPELFEFDHVHPDSSIGTPVAILYGALGIDCFREFHTVLVDAARQVFSLIKRCSSIICLINHLIELLFSFNKALLLVPREGATSIGQIGLTFHVVFFLFRGKRNCLFNKLLPNFMYKLFCQLYI